MRVYEYGDPRNPIIVLIHGMLTPHTIFEEHAAYWSRQYFVIVPALDGHDGDATTDFISAEQQAHKLATYLFERGYTDIFAVCGLSLGGVIAFVLWQRNTLHISHLILDGAPLAGFGKLLSATMTNQYLSIIKNSKSRNRRTLENFKKHFLPARFLDDYLCFADAMNDDSVRNLIAAAAVNRLTDAIPETDTTIHYLHGTTINEHTSKKTARCLKKLCSDINIICFKRDAHCYKAIYKPTVWLKTVEKLTLRAAQNRKDLEQDSA